MKRLVVVGMLFSLLICSGCGSEDKQTKKLSNYNNSNQESLDELSTLITSHPELGKATLKQIKDASTVDNSDDKAGVIEVEIVATDINDDVLGMNAAASAQPPKNSEPPKDAPTIDAEELNIDAEVANQAQALIDKALDQFDFEVQVQAAFKLVGIALNMQKEMVSDVAGVMNKQEQEEPFFQDIKNAPAKEKMTCEQFLSNPFANRDKTQFDNATKANRALIKQTVSGCPTMKASEFLSCVQGYNNFFSLINEHASCDIKNLGELDAKLNAATDGKFTQLGDSVSSCLEKQFNSCGFSPQDPERIGNGKPASSAVDASAANKAPVAPSTPVSPSKPATPTKPATPATPTKPGQPNTPANPATPNAPNTPNTPTNPTKPATT